ncbi:PRC-barrel domain-containing protein [Telmatospirillum sp.]|uniref:PRC-barrel domain-containing protein n=1 Tax=Telmatospirillum sp. TaxID=2079197 RepID=UPI00283F6D29|nr:PRC-barrel domain-containing protein [Telmatospirillum sp.]MDR3440546.1 PRC-barrel domain-containing protein [Telmatospirillum sp.]
MLLVVSTLKDYTLVANDGVVGTISDFLFDDETWKIRWLVVDTGTWLPGRKVLLHPSAIGQADVQRHELPVTLMKAQVEESPTVGRNQPLSQQVEAHLCDYYGWDRDWGSSFFGTPAIALPLAAAPDFSAAAVGDVIGAPDHPDKGDSHLHSIAAVTDYHIRGIDGEIGHVENFLIDSASWGIRYIIVDTENWWPGKHVLVSPYAVQEIRWSDRQVRLDVTRTKVKSSPPWDSIRMFDRAYEKRLHIHYGWLGYGF